MTGQCDITQATRYGHNAPTGIQHVPELRRSAPGSANAEFFEYEVLGKFQTRPLTGAEFF